MKRLVKINKIKNLVRWTAQLSIGVGLVVVGELGNRYGEKSVKFSVNFARVFCWLLFFMYIRFLDLKQIK